MYASVRNYKVDPAALDEVLRRVDAEFVPKIRREPGFVAYQCVDSGEDELATVSVFHDFEGAERSVELAAEFVKDRLPDVEIARLAATSGSVKISIAAQEMLEPAHV